MGFRSTARLLLVFTCCWLRFQLSQNCQVSGHSPICFPTLKVRFLLFSSWLRVYESKVAQLCLTLCTPTRLLCPWDFPGKSTGVGFHFLLRGYLPDPGIEPRYPALQTDALPSEPSFFKKPFVVCLVVWGRGKIKASSIRLFFFLIPKLSWNVYGVLGAGWMSERLRNTPPTLRSPRSTSQDPGQTQ